MSIGGTSTIKISGGSFTSVRRGFELLNAELAKAAFHDSEDRIEPPKCHPNTRMTILHSIFNWLVQSEDRRQWLLWLNGEAGTGKSAIVQTLAERCADLKHIAVASFFFSKTDSARNSIIRVIPTLMYQLIHSIPRISSDVLQTIEQNPFIFSKPLGFQFDKLLIQPLLRLPVHLRPVVAIFCDGLDECNDRGHQSSLINLFSTIVQSRSVPIIFLVASRREPQIEKEFIQDSILETVQTINLDSDIIQTSDDIRCFLNDKLAEIKKNHLYQPSLDASWPPASAVEVIVARSSGRFVYIIVAIRYMLYWLDQPAVILPARNPEFNVILHPHPAVILDILQVIQPRTTHETPHAHLDALYYHIFTRVREIDMVQKFIGLKLTSPNFPSPQFDKISAIEQVLLLEAGRLKFILGDLTAILPWGHRLDFIHSSVCDFLLDKSRSIGYFIDLKEYRTKLLCMFLQKNRRNSYSPTSDQYTEEEVPTPAALDAISTLLEHAQASELLRCAITESTFAFRHVSNWSVERHVKILYFLESLDFGDEGKAYQHVLQMIAAEYSTRWSTLSSDIKIWIRESPQLCASICNHRPELKKQPSLDVSKYWWPFS
ncbi:hypothetical protein BDN70DRAFT_993940 [Pholiota conissans]|uniref:Nephrocystin 3-like N-terminal domain-containing protein n=1 Tax=Pholiota conissans TaxID=109636 RepID=A0A9P5Z2T2_9AGAR|nr:hypothetical protein BDN70DRAFT_993940 [Pholiota conissans]